MVLELDFLRPTEVQQKFTGFRSTLVWMVFNVQVMVLLVYFVTAKRGKIPIKNEYE